MSLRVISSNRLICRRENCLIAHGRNQGLAAVGARAQPRAQRPLWLIEYQGIFMMLKREVNTEFNKTMLSDTSQMIETEAQL